MENFHSLLMWNPTSLSPRKHLFCHYSLFYRFPSLHLGTMIALTIALGTTATTMPTLRTIVLRAHKAIITSSIQIKLTFIPLRMNVLVRHWLSRPWARTSVRLLPSRMIRTRWERSILTITQQCIYLLHNPLRSLPPALPPTLPPSLLRAPHRSMVQWWRTMMMTVACQLLLLVSLLAPPWAVLSWLEHWCIFSSSILQALVLPEHRCWWTLSGDAKPGC